jgi:UDP-GlcNAc3NAcA epimerase
MIKLLTIIGARPQFIKAASLSAEIRNNFSHLIEESIVHTGQHFDQKMSSVFFDELGLPAPKYQLPSKVGSHGITTGTIMAGLDDILDQARPDLVLVYGDTNSTLAGALSAVKAGVPVAHVEAGLRSFNWNMPEEINRTVTDRISALNLAPSERALDTLQTEGLGQTAHLVGDIMMDSVTRFAPTLPPVQIGTTVLPNQYYLATIHRQENTDDSAILVEILDFLVETSRIAPVILPMHPRLRKRVAEINRLESLSQNLIVLEPVSFVEMLGLMRGASALLTDSGGLQKEAFFLGLPCVTIRTETEWTETIELGWNLLAPASQLRGANPIGEVLAAEKNHAQPYGDGRAADRITRAILDESWRGFFVS